MLYQIEYAIHATFYFPSSNILGSSSAIKTISKGEEVIKIG